MAADGASGAAFGIGLMKILPSGIGAAIMVAVDPPRTRRELFGRALVAFACSHLFSEFAGDLLHSYWAMFDPSKPAHDRALGGAIGALGWFLAGGVSVMAKRFKRNPLETVDALRRAWRGDEQGARHGQANRQ
jgi:hypothetical protein